MITNINNEIYEVLRLAGVQLNESVNKGIDFIAYHGGVEPDMIPAKDRPLYLTDSFELAHKFAKREIWNDGLYEGEIPTVFTFKGHFNNPYYMTLDEYNDGGQDSNIDIQKWIELGVDGIVLPPNEEGSTTYYIVIDTSTIKLIDKKVFEDEAILDESVENADILKNPTRNELKRYNVDKWRLLQDIDGNYYFADAFKYTHDMMSNKLRSNGISAVDANTDNCGIILYNVLTNTFYYRLLGIIDYEDVEAEYKSSYLSKEFPNADLSQSNDDDEELDESVGGNYL